ncbi:MAG: FliH/SctL family protein [Chitinispirillia bacterium]|nr:FliH/SctL family protein [Chitinispirillia bacterium]
MSKEREETIVNEKVSVLLDELLKAKDPATIGIRRIIRNKIDEHNNYPVRPPSLESFDSSGKPGNAANSSVFNENERAYLELEKRVRELERTITQEKVQAKRAVAESFEKGKKEGYAEGEKQGRETADAKFKIELDGIKNHTDTCFKKLEVSKSNMYHDLDRVLLEFCIELTKKIIASEVATNKELILSVIKKSLVMIAERDNIVIRVSPQDLEITSHSKDFWSSVTERLENVKFEADSRIEKGGCIIESNSGMVDARLGVQIDEVAELVLKAWESCDTANEG